RKQYIALMAKEENGGSRRGQDLENELEKPPVQAAGVANGIYGGNNTQESAKNRVGSRRLLAIDGIGQQRSCPVLMLILKYAADLDRLSPFLIYKGSTAGLDFVRILTNRLDNGFSVDESAVPALQVLDNPVSATNTDAKMLPGKHVIFFE